MISDEQQRANQRMIRAAADAGRLTTHYRTRTAASAPAVGAKKERRVWPTGKPRGTRINTTMERPQKKPRIRGFGE